MFPEVSHTRAQSDFSGYFRHQWCVEAHLYLHASPPHATTYPSCLSSRTYVTPVRRQIAMLSSVLDVIDLEGRNQGDEIRFGGFDLIHAGGTTFPSTNRTGDGSSLYTTALGTEIPQQRVDRMLRSPDTSLPPAGPSGGNATDGSSRRHSSSLWTTAGAGATGGETGGGGGASASPARGVSGRCAGGGGGGASGGSSGSGSSRSSSSMARGIRTSSSDSLSRDSRGEGRAGRNEAGIRGSSSRGGDRSSAGGGGGYSGGTGSGSSRSSTGAKGGKSGERDRDRDRGERNGRDNRHRDRGERVDEKRGGKSPTRPVEDGAARSLPSTSRGSSSDSEKLLTAPVRKGNHSS